MERTRIEIDRRLVEDVRRQADVQKRDERELLEEMIEESIRARRIPGVGFRGNAGTGRRAYVMGTGLDVWEIIQMYEDMGREMLLESFDALSEGKPGSRAILSSGISRGDRNGHSRESAFACILAPALSFGGSASPGTLAQLPLRLLLDAHVSGKRVGRRLSEAGHDVRAADTEPDLFEGMDDHALLELAAREERILVSFNVKDFPAIAAQWASKGKGHAGLIMVPNNVRHQEFGLIVESVSQMLQDSQPEEWENRFEWLQRR